MNTKKNIVIIGNGISGITAARYIRKYSKHTITIISNETDHFFSRTALMYIYMGHLTYKETKPYEDWFWKKNKINLLKAYVEKINFSKKTLHLKNFKEKEMHYDILILATGSKPIFLNWPGKELKGVQGLYSYQSLEWMEKNTKNTKKAVIIGGGLIGVEMAEMLLSRGIQVTFLIRSHLYFSSTLPEEEANLITREIKRHHVILKTETELKEILPNQQGQVKAIITTKNEEIPCDFLGVTIGVKANVDFLKESDLEIGKKGILVNDYMETNMEDVYAIGDCSALRNPSPNRKSSEPLWYTGKMQGECIARSITLEKTPYLPGIWFNSAKFFNIEYQTYGMILNQIPENEASLYWEDPNGQRCIRITYLKSNQTVTGFNFLGIRGRHQICEEWIHEKQKLPYVLAHLGQINFDPEFYKRFEKDVLNVYNNLHRENPIKLKSKKGLFAIFESRS